MRGFMVILLVLATIGLVSCNEASSTSLLVAERPVVSASPVERWYSKTQVNEGKEVFATYCAACHGPEAQGVGDWQQVVDSDYPPPALNGTAHAWHHDLSVLRNTIASGGIPLGGKMPPFGQVTSALERDAAIAYFQHFWSDELYGRWATAFQVSGPSGAQDKDE